MHLLVSANILRFSGRVCVQHLSLQGVFVEALSLQGVFFKFYSSRVFVKKNATRMFLFMNQR